MQASDLRKRSGEFSMEEKIKKEREDGKCRLQGD